MHFYSVSCTYVCVMCEYDENTSRPLYIGYTIHIVTYWWLGEYSLVSVAGQTVLISVCVGFMLT